MPAAVELGMPVASSSRTAASSPNNLVAEAECESVAGPVAWERRWGDVCDDTPSRSVLLK